MNAWLDFVQRQLIAGAIPTQMCEWPAADRDADLEVEYRRLRDEPAVVDRFYRGSFEITAADRVSWLHDLTTNTGENAHDGRRQLCLRPQLAGSHLV